MQPFVIGKSAHADGFRPHQLIIDPQPGKTVSVLVQSVAGRVRNSSGETLE